MGKSIVDTIQYVAEKMCGDYCKYHAQAAKSAEVIRSQSHDVNDVDEVYEELINKYCKDCPINDLW